MSVWRLADDELLRELWDAEASADEMTDELGRSRNSVYARAKALGLAKRRNTLPWTRNELEFLRRLFKRGLTDEEIAGKLTARSLVSLVNMRRQMGLVRESGAARSPPRPMMAVGPARTCQYIEGEVPKGRAPDFCGKPSIGGKSYCAAHAARCYKPTMDMTDAGEREGVPVRKVRKRASAILSRG